MQITCEHCKTKKEVQDRGQRYCSRSCVTAAAFPADFQHRFFESDSPDAAYWAGFIVADGNLRRPQTNRSARLSIGLHPKDVDHLYLFRDTLGATHLEPQPAKTRPLCSLTINHDELCAGLSKWGVIPNKTYDLREPPAVWSEPRITPHFLRGLWDGDGSIFLRRNRSGRIVGCQVSVTGNPWIMDWVRGRMVEVGFSPNIHDRGHKSLADGTDFCNRTISLYIQREAADFVEYIRYLDDEVVALSRKRNDAKTLVSWVRAKETRNCRYCGDPFSPKNGNQLSCTPACRDRHRMREYRASR